MISGYVIFMSLDASTGLLSFARKRWLRLFPAMLIVTCAILLTPACVPERPLGIPRLIDAIPGLTFIEASWYRDLLHIDMRDLEGAFWSLYVEVRFYALLGVLYFTLGRRKAVVSLAVLMLIMNVLKALAKRGTLTGPTADAVQLVSEVLIIDHLPWFFIGIVSYLATRNELGKWGYPILVPVLCIGLLHMREDHLKVIAAIAITAIFLLVMWHGKLLAFFRWRLFAFFGAISYPLYLFHENAGIALIIKSAKLHLLPDFLLPVLVLAAMALIAYVIATRLEPALHRLLRGMIMPTPRTPTADAG